MDTQSEIMLHIKGHRNAFTKQKTAYFRKHLLPFFKGKLEDRSVHFYYHCKELNFQYYAKSDKAFFIDDQIWIDNAAEELLWKLDLL